MKYKVPLDGEIYTIEIEGKNFAALNEKGERVFGGGTYTSQILRDARLIITRDGKVFITDYGSAEDVKDYEDGIKPERWVEVPETCSKEFEEYEKKLLTGDIDPHDFLPYVTTEDEVKIKAYAKELSRKYSKEELEKKFQEDDTFAGVCPSYNFVSIPDYRFFRDVPPDEKSREEGKAIEELKKIENGKYKKVVEKIEKLFF